MTLNLLIILLPQISAFNCIRPIEGMQFVISKLDLDTTESSYIRHLLQNDTCGVCVPIKPNASYVYNSMKTLHEERVSLMVSRARRLDTVSNAQASLENLVSIILTKTEDFALGFIVYEAFDLTVGVPLNYNVYLPLVGILSATSGVLRNMKNLQAQIS